MWRNRPYLTDLDVLLTIKCCTTGVSVREFTLQHARAGNGAVAFQNFAEKSVVGPYYGSLVYESPVRELHLRKQYEKRFAKATSQSL